MAAKKNAKSQKPPVNVPKITKTNKKGTVKKPQIKKKRKPPVPKITNAMFNNYFFKLSHEEFVQLTEEWNDVNLKLRLQKHTTYDGWLNYFKTLSVNQLKLLSSTGLDILPAEAYAALSFWRDIMTYPSRIKNIHRAGLTTGKGDDQSISERAEKNDRYGVLKAIRNQLANKLQNNPGNRDTADLSKQLTEVMTQIAEYERRLAPDKKTELGELLSDMPTGEIKPKRPSKTGGGARQTSFKSRVTIKDVEGK